MSDLDGTLGSQITLIGCCGAFCGKCRQLTEGICKGCKLGYDEGMRNINAARCRIKLCCFREKKIQTCSDCPEFPGCRIIHDFYGNKGYKYGKYCESIEFIKKHGYQDFLEQTCTWKNEYGRLELPARKSADKKKKRSSETSI